jgi:hypothetical protein
MGHERIIERIRKLLSLAKSDNEHEAANAAAKAQELLSQYNLSMSDIPAGDDGKVHADTARAKTRVRLERWAKALACRTGKAFDCAYYHSLGGHTCFVGVGADQQVCAWTYGYLYKTLLRMGSKYMQTPRCRRLRSSRSKSLARESYLLGAVWSISDRLEAQRERTPVTQAALVPVKEDAIRAAMPDGLRSRNLDFKGIRDADLEAGFTDGLGVPLSTPLIADHQDPLVGATEVRQ